MNSISYPVSLFVMCCHLLPFFILKCPTSVPWDKTKKQVSPCPDLYDITSVCSRQNPQSSPFPRYGSAFLVLVYGGLPKGGVKTSMQNKLNLKRVELRLWLVDQQVMHRRRLDLYVTEARIWSLRAWFLWAVYLTVI